MSGCLVLPAASTGHAGATAAFARTLGTWPYREYWAGTLFHGARIGYSHLRLEPADHRPGSFTIHSEAFMRFHFKATDKRVDLSAVDQVDGDLSLRSFHYDFDLDGSRLALRGEVHDGSLTVEVRTSQQTNAIAYALDGPIYPSSAIVLYPLLHGLAVGRRYAYTVYSGETRTLDAVTQEVVAYGPGEGYRGNAYRIRTQIGSKQASTWIDDSGRPVLEKALDGVFESRLEPEDRARNYLTLAVLNKQDAVLDLSLIPSEPPVQRPRQVGVLDLVLEGVPDDFPVPSDALQHCRRERGGVRCRVDTNDSPGTPVGPRTALAFLGDSLAVPTSHPRIGRLARTVNGRLHDARQQIQAILDWLGEHVRREPVDVFSALDVLDTGRAECQGHTYLYTALARSLGIPTRVVNGIVYSSRSRGFLYHTWAESVVDGRWVAVDPTFGQARADATHLKLIVGEELAQLTPLARLVGKLRVRVISARY